MNEPRVIDETEVAASVVHQLHPQRPEAPAPQPPAINLAMVYQGIAMVLAVRLNMLLLVVAMICMSAAAVAWPDVPRLWAAGGFDAVGLIGLWMLGSKQ